jgi:ABC-type branched-subunit amino acid transport system ATPase component/MFS family permease
MLPEDAPSSDAAPLDTSARDAATAPPEGNKAAAAMAKAIEQQVSRRSDRPTKEAVDWAQLLRESVKSTVQPRRWFATLRHPIAALQRTVGSGPVYPLLILFGLNAADELDRTGFGILVPNIRDDLGMSNQGILSLIGLTLLAALACQLPIAIWADRGNRVRIAMLGAAVWAFFSLLTGFSVTVWMLIIARSGAGIGRAVVDPTHNSLLADYYSVDRRAAVYSFHRSANAVGQFVGPLLAGGLAYATGNWHVPFFVFAVPTLVLVVLGLRLAEPIRGAQERQAMGASADAVDTEEPAISFGEAYRLVSRIDSLRRLWYAVPFLAVALIGFVTLGGLLYEDVFQLDELQRGYLAAFVEPFQLVGLGIGAAVGMRLFLRDPSLIFRFLRGVAILSGVFALAFAFAPTVWAAVLANILLSGCLALLLPGLLASLSLAVPAKARSVGFALASYWAIPGLLILPLIGWISDTFSTRMGMAFLAPVLVIGGLVVSSVGGVINRDIRDVWLSSVSQSEAKLAAEAGSPVLLAVRDLHVSYDQLKVLTGVSIDVREGEVVALLGTNGAGKSTLINSISGVVEASFGAVIYDGRDITHAPPHEIATLGAIQMPGGHGVFPSLTVGENLAVAGYTRRHHREDLASDTERFLSVFPILRERMGETAANLSGGQQQQLALTMAMLTRPRLLMIDELSLGLAPVVVGQLAETVREIARQGTTIVLVEQSVNVALTLADTAYFMEKGVIRFGGPTAELLQRDDLLRSVFLGTGSGASGDDPPEGPPSPAAAPASHILVKPPTGDDPTGDDSTEAAIEAIDVSVSFGGLRAVDSVRLRVARGEIVGLIGQNGAGKTTLLDLLSGFNAADEGRVLLDGVDVTSMPVDGRARHGLGRSFQDARLFPGLTVEETVKVALESQLIVRDAFNAMLRTPPQIDSEWVAAERAQELLEQLGLIDYRDKLIGELSTGSRRVVDLACVIGHRPKVLLLDEPSSGIAQRETEALAPLLMKIRQEIGCAMVVVEHDMPLISSVADRLVAMETGRVLAEGTPAETLSNPAVIASYLGTSQELISRSGAATAASTTGISTTVISTAVISTDSTEGTDGT